MKSPVILLADDDEDDRDLFARAIQEIDSSASCYLVKNGLEVIELLPKQEIKKPDLIFLDVNMPVMDGWECLKELKENNEYKDTPVVIYSTTSQDHHVEKAISLGAVCLITKPDSFKKIKEILTEVISNPVDKLLEGIKAFPEVKWKE